MRLIATLIFIVCTQSLFSQIDYSKWEGSWKGQIQNPNALALEVRATITAFNQYEISLNQGSKILLKTQAQVDSNGLVIAKLGPLQFKGAMR